MLKCLQHWSAYTSNRALKRQQERTQIAIFGKIKAKLVAKHIFDAWSRRTSQIMHFTDKANMCARVYEQKLRCRVFMAWRVYLKQCWRKKLLQSQAQWFLDTRFKTEFFFKWKTKYEHEQELREKNQRALIFWSINIQRTCFAAWLDWSRFKRHKKERYKAALHQRQLDILRVCGRNFINYAMDSRQRRLVANRHLTQRYLSDASHLQAKYFRIWYNKCHFKQVFSDEPKLVPKFKVNEIEVGPTLAKQEALAETTYAPIKLDAQSKVRPAPRKPVFLNESVDLHAPKSDLVLG